jgi:hypothetical protein
MEGVFRGEVISGSLKAGPCFVVCISAAIHAKAQVV